MESGKWKVESGEQLFDYQLFNYQLYFLFLCLFFFFNFFAKVSLASS